MGDQEDSEFFEPVPVALLFADRVITEEGNKKKTIVGSFARFTGPTFPIAFAPWFIYTAFTNVIGKHSFSCYLVLERTEQFVATFGGEVNIAEKNAFVELVFPVMGAVFPVAADYICVFKLDGKQVIARNLEVRASTAAN